MIPEEKILSAKILIVDDQPVSARILEEILRKAGYQAITSVYDSRDVKEAYKKLRPDAVILDLNMPYLDGFQVMTQLRETEGEEYIPILVLTQVGGADIRYLALEAGARDYLNKPYDRVEVIIRIRNIIETHILYDQMRNQNKLLEDKVFKRTQDLYEAQLDMVHRLARIAEFRDRVTGLHILRMSYYCAALAAKLGFSKEECDTVQVASALHDIGKVSIPDSILLKRDRLNNSEREIMKTHATVGSSLLSGSKAKVMQMAKEIALTHHEKWDGSGYPRGLKGEQIPLVGRICGLCDMFDALVSERPYKKAWPAEEAIEEIKKERGVSFEPRLVTQFLEILPEIREIKEKYDNLRVEDIG
jgi:putative two-component system response regulator